MLQEIRFVLIASLKVFCDLVETQSFSRTAVLNHVTQSAVSQQLKSIQKRQGNRLVEREKRRLRLTAEGGGNVPGRQSSTGLCPVSPARGRGPPVILHGAPPREPIGFSPQACRRPENTWVEPIFAECECDPVAPGRAVRPAQAPLCSHWEMPGCREPRSLLGVRGQSPR